MDRMFDDDEEVQYIRNDLRYYQFSYLEAKKDKLNLSAPDDAMLSTPFSTAKIDFIKPQLRATV